MDTKSQNKAPALLAIVVAVLLFGLALLTSFEKKLDYDESNVSFFRNSPEIQEAAIRYAKNLQRYYIYYEDFDIKAATLKLAEIDSRMAASKSGSNNHLPWYGSHKSNSSAGPSIYSGDNYNVRPKSLYNIDIDNTSTDELAVIQDSLNDAISNYNTVEEYLRSNNDFHFMIYNTNLDRVLASNSEDFYNEENYEIIQLSDNIFKVSFNGEYLCDSFANQGLRCFISIPHTTSKDIKLAMMSVLDEINYNKIISSPVLPLCFACIGLAILLVLWLNDSADLKYYNDKIYKLYCAQPFVVKVPLFCMLVSFIIRGHFQDAAHITGLYTNRHFFTLFATLIVSSVSVVFIYLSIRYLIRIIKNPSSIVNETDANFITTIGNDLKLAMNAHRPILFALLLCSVTVIGISIFSIFVCLIGVSMLVRTFAIYIALLAQLGLQIIIYKAIISEIKLRYYIKEMADGNIDTIPHQSGLFSNSINNINDINTGLKKIMEDTLKNERLKTELITNVSHDLKTPLTSIISYVDLLSALDLDNEHAKEYIGVIKSKSRRLKILIEDLFEASKLSSGQMKLEFRQSDIVSLLEQTMGELETTIDDSGITFVTNIPSHPIMMNIDGQKMWRAFDNLIINIIKYSPTGSRAFVDMIENDKCVTITFKNVANYQMDFEADELFERFKRGDKARTTEGSGLGLSITKSIIELHGGKLNIITDGDLFKINIVLFKQIMNEEE